MSKLISCLINCYQADHTECYKYSFLCYRKSKQNWFMDNPYCGPDFRMFLDEDRTNLMQNLIKYRLAPEVIRKVPTPKNRQKCKAANRGITTSVPKNITFATNAAGRVHSAVRRMNWGPGQVIFHQAA